MSELENVMLKWAQPLEDWANKPVDQATAGVKYDGNYKEKPPMALLDPPFLEGIARVLGFGAVKYAPDNWRNGIAYRRLISAAYRHLGAISAGEDIDPESGLAHSYHLGCCVMFLASMMETRPDLDDRYKPTPRKPVELSDKELCNAYVGNLTQSR